MKALSYEYVKSEFEKHGWELLESEYAGSQVVMRCKCEQGHQTAITWNNFQKGQRCKFCAGNVKHSYEEVKRAFDEVGCLLLSNEYSNLFKPLDYKCKCGTVGKIRFADLRAGSLCKECKKRKLSEFHRTEEADVKQACEENGCQLLSSWMSKGKTRIRFLCKCGLEGEAYYCNFLRYPNCRTCGINKKSGPNCYMWNPDREQIASNKYWRKACERIVKRCLKAAGSVKGDRTQKLLGYTPDELRDHIENHPNGYGQQPHHIDHIFPVQAFLDHDIFDLRVINRLDNLQPLPGGKNLSKADGYDKAKFMEWLREL